MLNSVILPLCPDESTPSFSHRISREERKDLTSSLQRCEFERQKASRMKSGFFSFSPVKKTSQWIRRESTALSDLRAAVPEQLSLSPCATTSSEGSEVTPGSRLNMVMTPNTPELYSALKLPYYRSERILQSPDEGNMDWPF